MNKVIERQLKASALIWMLVMPGMAQENAEPSPIVVPQAVAPVSKEVSGEVTGKFIIVDDLIAKPVPLTAFRVTRIGEAPEVLPLIRTGEDGSFRLKLAPGRYRIENEVALEFKGKSYKWNHEFEVRQGEVITLQLTGDDAKVSDQTLPTTRQVADEAKVYRALQAGIATVEGEGGNGTGFLVDERGLLLTNQHVIHNSRRLVVRFRHGLRVEAHLIESDANADVAVLRVHPEVIKGLPVVPLADVNAETPLAVEGEKVLAIGSPLGEEKILTTGLISRVKDDILISDININPGNSGGPLLNMAGQAIGLTTFGQSSSQGGPGLSGIVSITRVLPLLEKARTALSKEGASGTNGPSAQLLADFSSYKVPAELLTEATKTALIAPLIKAPWAFQTQFYTPFIAASLAAKEEREWARKKKWRTKAQDARGARATEEQAPKRFYESSEAQVLIAVAPTLAESQSSKRRGLLGGILGGLGGVPVFTKKAYVFRHDFYDMELYRDGVLVEPLRRKRVPVSAYYDLPMVLEVKDMAYAGVYSYDPAVFRPGGKLELRVRREYNLDKWDVLPLPEKISAPLYNQFAPYYQSINADGAAKSEIALSKSAK